MQIDRQPRDERGASDKVLYAFSDFTHPETNAEIHKHVVNELKEGELIEERSEGDDYRLMIVANKFQTGFDRLEHHDVGVVSLQFVEHVGSRLDRTPVIVESSGSLGRWFELPN